jgi:hypothetical protein
MGLQASLYWRVDDLPLDGKGKLKPKFSFYASYSGFSFSARALLVDDNGFTIDATSYNLDLDENDKYVDDNESYYALRISLTKAIAKEYLQAPRETTRALKLRNTLKELLVFDSAPKAKYIYLQLFFDSLQSTGRLEVTAAPAEYEREVDLDKLLIRGHDPRNILGTVHRTPNIAQTVKLLCSDFGIAADDDSFEEASKELPRKPDLDGASTENFVRYLEPVIPFIPFKHGDKFADKFAEICRAAGISMFTDGSKLYARNFYSETPKEEKWIATPDKVMKSGVEVRGSGTDSIATEWSFSVNTWDGQKTLAMGTSAAVGKLEEEWQASDIPPFRASLIYRGYIDKGASGFGARALGEDAEKFRIGGMYSIKIIEELPPQICKLVSLRIDSSGADALFVFEIPPLRSLQTSGALCDELEITPLAQQSAWRNAASGNLAIGYEHASCLWQISQEAFAKTKQKAKLDERYSKHEIAAFGGDEFWPQRLLRIAEHNSFAKTIISFKVPLNHLPEGSLSGLLLRRITLAFGRFRNNTLEGWIIGYSLCVAEDSMRITFMNSEPIKDILWLDENLLEYPLTVDERKFADKKYSEV